MESMVKALSIMNNIPKKKNHEVTKGLLKRWRNREEKLWVFDIKTQKIEARSLDATFAIEDYLYVPSIEGQLTDVTEEWFSGAENELAILLQRISNKDFEKPMDSKKLFLILLALMGLSYRSSYELNKIITAIESDKVLSEKPGIDLSTPEQRKQFAIENMINIITQRTELFCKGSVTIIFGTKTKLLICDRPGADEGFVKGGMFFLPLGPNEYVFMDATTQGAALIRGAVFMPSNNEQLVHSINQQTISRARKWVVAQTREELEAIASQLTIESVARREAKDSLEFRALTEAQRNKAWSLKKPNE